MMDGLTYKTETFPRTKGLIKLIEDIIIKKEPTVPLRLVNMSH